MKNNWKSCLIAAVALIAVATIHAQSSGTYTVHNLTVGGTATGSFGGGGSGTFQATITDLKPTRSTDDNTNDTLNIAAGRCMGTNKSAATAQVTAGNGNGSYVAYCTDSQTIVVEHSTSAGLTVSCTNCVPLQVTTPAIPEGMVPIATGTLATGATVSAWSDPTDARDWALGGLRISNGAGSASSLSSGVLTIALDAAQVWLQGNTLAPTAGVDFTGATTVKPFEHRTSDPTCTSIDGRVWYRTDTDAYKACANDAVVSLSGGGGLTFTTELFWPFGMPSDDDQTLNPGANVQRAYRFVPMATFSFSKIRYRTSGTGYVAFAIVSADGSTILTNSGARCNNNTPGAGAGYECALGGTVTAVAGTPYYFVFTGDASTGIYVTNAQVGNLGYAAGNGFGTFIGTAANNSTGSAGTLAVSVPLGTISAHTGTIAGNMLPSIVFVP